MDENYKNISPTRRTFIKNTALFGAAFATGGAFTLGSANAAPPMRGGTLRVAMGPGSTSDSLDPMTYFDSPQYTAGFTLGNCLVEMTKDKQPIPELAESWGAQDTFKKWTFKIRSGVTFHNGKPLTAADVVYSLNRHITPDSASAAKGLLAGITSVEAVGDLEVVVNHESGTPDLPVILGDFHLVIIPDGFTDFANFIGTGPYKLVKFEPGVILQTERYENYWKPDRAWVDRFELVFINDAAAAVNALMTGEVLGIAKIGSQAAKRFEQLGRFNLIKSEGSLFNNLDMNCQSPLWSDNNVRLAMKWAIDRQKMVDLIGNGYGAVGNDNPVPPNDPFFNAELPQRVHDPEKARFYLKKAGLEKLDVTLQVSDAAYAGAEESAALLQDVAKASSINIAIKKEPADGYWSNVWLKSDFMIAYFAARPTPDMMFSVFYRSGAPWNESHWSNEKFDKLLVQGRQTDDFAKRKDIYAEMQQLVHDESGIASFMLPSTLDAYSPTVQGVEPDGVRSMMGCRIAERAWLQS